ILDAGFHAPLLLLLTDLQPELDQIDPGINEESLKRRNVFEKSLVLFLRAEIHHVLDSGAIVPTAVENDDLASCRKMLEIALPIKLRLFPVGRSRQRHKAEHAWADALGDRFDRSSLACGIAPFEHDDGAQPLMFHPILEPAQLGLELAQFLL